MISKSHRSIQPASPAPRKNIFVYGTLKSTHWNNHFMRAARGKLLGNAVTLLRFPLLVMQLPKLLPFCGHGEQVHGELYSVPEKRVFRILDALEGHPYWYRRLPIDVLIVGEACSAEAYFLTSNYIPENWEDLPFHSRF